MLESIEEFVTEYPKKKLNESIKTMGVSEKVKENNKKDVENVLSVEERFFLKLEELGINLEELKDVLKSKGNTLINSCAGSGKTTAMVLKIIYDLLTGDTLKDVKLPDKEGTDGKIIKGASYKVPKKILVSTFLKTGAEEIKKAFNNWCRLLGLKGISADILTVKTMHAEFYDVIKGIYGNVNLVSDTSKYVRQIMQERKIRSRTAYSKTLTIDEVKDMECIMTYARNRLDASRYKHPLMSDYGLYESTLNLILQDFQIKKQAAGGELDFEDLQELLYAGAQQNINLQKYLADRYDVIYLDEFQDTAQLQYSLLKYYFAGVDKVVVVGDEDQCIYSWRGSDIQIITEQFEKDYKPSVLNLSMNYRCARNILNPITTSIVLNSGRHEKMLRAYKAGGSVRIVYSKNPDILIKGVLDDLRDNKTVGIISRTNYDLLVPALILELNGGVIFNTSKQVTMDNRLAKQVCGIIDIVTKRYTNEFENYLSLFLSRYRQYEAEMVCQMLSANPMQTLYTVDMNDLEYSAPCLANLIKGIKDVKQNKGDVEAYLYILDVMRTSVFNGDSQYAMRARDFISFIIGLIRESELFKDKDINEIDRILNEVLPKRLKDRASNTTDTRIKLTTVHEAKGKEWDSVYIWNDIDGVFPASVGKREITPMEYEEERRIHYIAWTRPKEKLTVFTSLGMESPFLKECTLGEGCKTDRGEVLVNADVVKSEIENEDGVQDSNHFELNKDVVESKMPNETINSFLARYIEARNKGNGEYADKVRLTLMKKPLEILLNDLELAMEYMINKGILDGNNVTFIDADDAMLQITASL